MKKLSLLVALALLVAFGAFAQVSLDYSVTGDAELIWGVRLDVPKGSTGVGQTHGFETKTNSSLDLTITLDPASVTKGGSGVYGEITLSGFGVAVGDGEGVKWEDNVKAHDEDGDTYDVELANKDAKIDADTDKYDYTWIDTGIAVTKPDVAAKIVLSDALFVKIASKPDFDANLDTIADDSWTKVDFDFDGGGATVGYMSDMADVNFMVATPANFESNVYYRYAAGMDATVKAIDIVSLTAKAYYTESLSDKEDSVWYIGAGLSSTPIDMLTVNFDAAIEILPQDGDPYGEDLDNKLGDEGMNYEMDLDIPVSVTDSITVTPRVSFGSNTTKYNESDMLVAELKALTGTDLAGIDAWVADPARTPAELASLNAIASKMGNDAKNLSTSYEGDLDLQLKVEMTGDLSLSVTATAEDVLAHGFSKDYMEYEGPHGDKTQEYDNMTFKLDVAGSYTYALSDSTYVKPGFDTTLDAKHTNVREWMYYYDENGKSSDGDELAAEGQTDDVMDIDVYLEAGLIDNTVFKLNWHSDQIFDESVYKDDKAGDVTFSTKISY